MERYVVLGWYWFSCWCSISGNFCSMISSRSRICIFPWISRLSSSGSHCMNFFLFCCVTVSSSSYLFLWGEKILSSNKGFLETCSGEMVEDFWLCIYRYYLCSRCECRICRPGDVGKLVKSIFTAITRWFRSFCSISRNYCFSLLYYSNVCKYSCSGVNSEFYFRPLP